MREIFPKWICKFGKSHYILLIKGNRHGYLFKITQLASQVHQVQNYFNVLLKLKPETKYFL